MFYHLVVHPAVWRSLFCWCLRMLYSGCTGSNWIVSIFVLGLISSFYFVSRIGDLAHDSVEVVFALQWTLTRSLLACFQTIGLTLDECVHKTLYGPLKVVFVSAPGIGTEVEATASASLGARAPLAEAISLSVLLWSAELGKAEQGGFL